MLQRMVKQILYIVLIALACSAYALSSDREQVMHVMADTANLSQQEHKGTYVGNVELIQGTTNLQEIGRAHV